MFTKIKTLIISVFIILNLFTVAYYHFPQRIRRVTDKIFPSLKLIREYASAISVTAHWGMFTSLEKEKWWILIKGKYENSQEEVILPIPLQGKRDFLEKYFFDFREVKFFVNLFKEKYRQERYARYLCRRFPENKGSKIIKIIYEQYIQKKYNPKEAWERGYYLEPSYNKTVLNTYYCGVS